MADLITAARTQLRYTANELKSGDAKAAADHLAKADAFLERAGVHQASLVAVAEDPAPVEWTGTFDEALSRFLDALEAKQKADGVEVLIRGSYSGHAYTRDENIALAESIGVLEELGGADFFGPDLGPDVKQ